MASQNYNTPDLNSVLRTLSAFANQTHNHHQPQSTSTPTPPKNQDANDNDNDYEPPDALPLPPSLPIVQTQPSPSLSSSSTLHHPSKPTHTISTPSHPKQTPHPKTGESSTITTWPAALKKVMRTVGQNEDIQRRIRFLIQRQNDHEKQWWRGREALLQKQRSRKEKKRELDEVLRSVGAPIDDKQVSTAEEDRAEVQNYDGKVYKASRQMAEALVAELRAMDIPFFCLKQSLIADETGKHQHQHQHLAGYDNLDKQQSPISTDELSVFQRRMLELLQDLCRE